jgi:hypothetical protein
MYATDLLMINNDARANDYASQLSLSLSLSSLFSLSSLSLSLSFSPSLSLSLSLSLQKPSPHTASSVCGLALLAYEVSSY